MRSTAAILILTLASVSNAGDTPALEKLGADIPAVIRQAGRDAAETPAAPSFQVAAVSGIWTDTDCKRFTFEENSPAESAEQFLRSETWLEECDMVPLPPPAGGICIPRRRLMRVDTRTVKIRIEGREVPGPKEVFEVCLWSAGLSLKVKQSPNKYDVKAQDEPVFNTTYVLKKKR